MIKGRQKSGLVRNFLRGFTMTESIVTLGVVGLVVGAIWQVWGATNNNAKMERGVNEIRQIAENIRKVYTGQPAAAASATTDIMVCSDIFMPELQQGANVTCSGARTMRRPVSAWGGDYQASFDTGGSIFNIEVHFPGTTPAQLQANRPKCIDLISKFPTTAAGQEGGPITAAFKSTSWQTPFAVGASPSTVANDMSSGCSAVRFQFRL